MMLPRRIQLVDRFAPLTRAWSEVFASHESVEVTEGDYFAHDADAMVSPANSFGIMDGGIDGAIRTALGGQVQTAVQAVILDRHHGELHVGTASAQPIETLLVPGLCTGIGAMDPRRCAAQMRMAFDQVAKPARIPSFATIHQLHQKLRSAL